ncbi:phage tail protein [Acinetobacter haemolyticus]|uniref:phage tail fiber protein n=1 Tax=Acinetobacter haemolyticus TaxID=29430 RepID=UPI001372A7EA|nr:phage tail protein [Acinetobacter haemolyticus]NAR78978.1 phage tail protein [Acinetobacter haemolyticus]
MAKQTINQGTAPTGAGGDTFRSGSAKLQANDNELYAQLGATAQGVLPAALPLNKGGTGATTATEARSNLGLGTAATATLTTSSGDRTSGRVLKVGDFGVGVRNAYNPGPGEPDLPFLNGFYTSTGGTGTAIPNGAAYIHSTYSDSAGFAIAGTASSQRLFAVFKHGNYPEYRVYDIRTEKNTTVDANGFIKNASPVVKLFADRIELNDEAKQQNIEFEKLGVGDYLIKGSSGFAQEGWYIETPKDANGNLLVAVVYEQLENGDISVKAYDYMLNNKGRIVADTETPLDIPEARWIDLRLQEIEVTDDPEQ